MFLVRCARPPNDSCWRMSPNRNVEVILLKRCWLAWQFNVTQTSRQSAHAGGMLLARRGARAARTVSMGNTTYKGVICARYD